MRYRILHFIVSISESVNTNAVEEDLENTKQRIGGQRIVKGCTKDTMFVGRTSHQFLARLPVDQREAFHHLPKFRDMVGWKSPPI